MDETRPKQRSTPHGAGPRPEARLALERAGGYGELYDAVLVSCRQIAGSDFVDCALGLVDPEDPEFFYPLRRGLPMRPPMKEPRSGESNILALGLASDEPLVLFDRAVEARPIGQARTANQQGQSQPPPWITAPLRRKKEKIGVLAVRVHTWGATGAPPYIRSIERLAEEIAWSAANCHQHEQREQTLNDYHDIFRVAAHLQSIRDPGELLAEACDALIRSFGFDRAAILLLDDPDGARELRWAASRGFEEPAVPTGQTIPLDGALAAALADNATRLIRSPREEHDAPEFMRAREQCCRAAILPLCPKNRPLGVICADHRFDHGQLNRRRVATLALFANQVALAIENARLYSRIETLARTDSLTSIYNRHYFDEALERETARVRRYGQQLCLMMVDLCDFKRFNDRFGHLTGDEMLRRVARLLRETVRASDIVCRFGGDEFVVLMPNTGLSQAEWVRARIEAAIEEANRAAASCDEHIRLSIGLRSAERQSPENLLAEADSAMYINKARQTRQGLARLLTSGPWGEVERADPFIGNTLRVLNDKDATYLDHARRVMDWSRQIATRLGRPPLEIEDICLGALLHDVGKVAFDRELLQRPSTLTPSEYRLIQTHAAFGADLIGVVAHLQPIVPIIRHHHERYDGRVRGQFPGYPDGLRGEDIPFGARVVKAADCFDCLTSERPYHAAQSRDEAIAVIRHEAGRSFDPQISAALLELLEECAEDATV